jgi:hypothetical protein
MVTGRPPFASSDVWQVIQMHLQADPPSPRRLNPEVPPELAGIVAQALRKEPGDRFTTAGAMATELASQATAIDSIALPPAQPPMTSNRRSLKLPPVFGHARRRAGRLAARLRGGDWRHSPTPAQLLGFQFIASFVLALLLLLALAGSLPPRASSGAPPYQPITKPLPPLPETPAGARLLGPVQATSSSAADDGGSDGAAVYDLAGLVNGAS